MATNWNALVEDDALKKEAKRRKTTFIEKKAWAVAREQEERLGFYYVSTYKDGQRILMHKDKKFDRQFEDDVWSIFYKLGFTVMNGPDNFIVQWGPGAKDTQQIDVFAIDEETAIVVECKAAETLKDGTTTFKKNIEALIAQKNGIQNEIHSHYPNRKVKFIWATHNINLDRNDIKRLEDNNIAYFDDEAVSYYESLVNYLGTAARYQMLGDLFRKTKIKNMDTKVPAIRGKMGGFEYYSFSVKPSLLLKIGYVLHQSYKTNLIWEKVRKDGEPDGRGVGFYFRNVTEVLLFGVKTKRKSDTFRTLKPGRSQVNLLRTRKREHSRKPDEFIDLIEACSPGPYLEMFARGARKGWTLWGDQANSDYEPTWNTYSNHTVAKNNIEV